MRFKNKVVIIMGAGSGIGRQASVLFSREGAKVVRVDINKDSLSELEKGKNFTKSGILFQVLVGSLIKRTIIDLIRCI